MPIRKKRWIAFAGFSAFFLLIAFNLERLMPIDRAMYNTVLRLKGDRVTAFFKCMTQLVHPILLLLISMFALALIKKRVYVVPVCANLGISVLLNLGLKSVFTRVRPQDVTHFIVETGYSFPSGHSMAACAFYGFLIYLVRQSRLKKDAKQILTAVLALLTALIGLSRIYLGAHYFTDVLAGFCVSSAYLIVFTTFVSGYFRGEKHIAHASGTGTLRSSFAHALDGIVEGLKAERNMIIHFGAATLVTVFGVILRISTQEWIACLLCIALVMAAELMNTAVETTVDLCSPEYSEKARRAKDTAAGAVLIAAVAATVIGLMIFVPKLAHVVMNEFM